MLKEEWKEILFGIIVGGAIAYFILSNEKVQSYMNCSDVPAYARTYETCF